MPNKNKFKKLQLNALRKGKLNDKADIKETLKSIQAKSAIDYEDINFDFDEKRAGFEKLADNDACDKKIRKSMIAEAKKRKSMAQLEKEKQNEAKKQKKEVKVESTPSKPSIVPKSSKKNKYFFMAHPDQLKKHAIETIQEISSSTNFVIDEEKIKLNKIMKEKKDIMKKNGTLEKNDNVAKGAAKKKKPSIWASGWCDTDEEIEVLDDSYKKNVTSGSHEIIDFNDLDKIHKPKLYRERQADGTVVEVYKHEPSTVKNDQNDDDEEDIADEADEEVTKEDKSAVNKSKADGGPEAKKNQLMEKLQSSRFRYLNELLYTQESDKSFKYFKQDSAAFDAYHEGFRNQVAKWPSNPLDKIIKDIQAK